MMQNGNIKTKSKLTRQNMEVHHGKTENRKTVNESECNSRITDSDETRKVPSYVERQYLLRALLSRVWLHQVPF